MINQKNKKEESIFLFDPEHDDAVHDMCYDFYGTRLATASSDQRIKVWASENRKWKLIANWKAHDASVVKLSFSHPNYGALLASCSLDRSVRIWEEKEEKWLEKCRLMDSRGSVTGIDFAPFEHGLRLITASTDGIIRIYDGEDATQWRLTYELPYCENLSESGGPLCAVWAKSTTLMFAVAGGPSQPRVYRFLKSWELMGELQGHTANANDVSWAPVLGRSYNLVATGCRDNVVRVFKVTESGMESIASLFGHTGDVWSVKWNITGTILSSTSDDGIRVWSPMGPSSTEWESKKIK